MDSLQRSRPNYYDNHLPGDDYIDTPYQYDDVDPDDDDTPYHVHDGDDGSTLVHYNDHPTNNNHIGDFYYHYNDNAYERTVNYGPGYAPDDRDE